MFLLSCVHLLSLKFPKFSQVFPRNSVFLPSVLPSHVSSARPHAGREDAGEEAHELWKAVHQAMDRQCRDVRQDHPQNQQQDLLIQRRPEAMDNRAMDGREMEEPGQKGSQQKTNGGRSSMFDGKTWENSNQEMSTGPFSIANC